MRLLSTLTVYCLQIINQHLFNQSVGNYWITSFTCAEIISPWNTQSAHTQDCSYNQERTRQIKAIASKFLFCYLFEIVGYY